MTVRNAFAEFQWLDSHSSSTGATITPGNNTYGTYVQLIAGGSLTERAYGIQFVISGVASSGQARDTCFKFGADPSGGSSYVDIGTDISCSCASSIGGGTGTGMVTPVIPIRFEAGTSIAIAMAINNATVGTGNAFCRLAWKPTHPELIPRTGVALRTYGVATPGSPSTATAITPNNAGGKSAFVQLGTIAAGDFPWFWFGGVHCNNSAMSNNASWWDWALGSGTGTNRIIIADDVVAPSSAETLTRAIAGVYAQGNPGDLVFVRAGGPAASPTGMAAAAYAVVG